jgi:hypothetical protein
VRYDPGEHLLAEACHSGMSYLPKGDILAWWAVCQLCTDEIGGAHKTFYCRHHWTLFSISYWFLARNSKTFILVKGHLILKPVRCFDLMPAVDCRMRECSDRKNSIELFDKITPIYVSSFSHYNKP